MDTTTPLLHLDRVTATRTTGTEQRAVLSDVTLSVATGEMTAVMGPSGSGKTSLVQAACGLLEPDAGTVAIDGAVVTTPLLWPLYRRRTIGVVHQQLDLIEGLTVIDNVALPMLLDRKGVRAAHAAATQSLERVGLGGTDRRLPSELSGGERQRVAIARAITGERRLLLADEPTAALDTVTAESVVQLLAGLAGDGRAVLMTTHDTRLAGWADRVITVRDGALI